MVYDYKKSGVDIDAGDALVDWLQEDDSSTLTTHNNEQIQRLKGNLIEGVGGFASLYRLPFADYKKPVLVTCTDGVGTKVLLAAQYKKYDGIGQDLVAMCVNDLICTGGDPHIFLDYFASAKLDLAQAKAFLTSVRRACDESECLLVGGETAEMPGVYKAPDFDCAGFAVGLVDEEARFGPHKVKVGDHLIGLPSSGFHSNGYSLLRKVFAADMDHWVDRLLTPTRLYVKILKDLKKRANISAVAHITGGGILNINRVIPEGLNHNAKWVWPEEFIEVQRRTGMSSDQMLTTLNCGLGLVLVLPGPEAEVVKKHLKAVGESFFELGEVF